MSMINIPYLTHLHVDPLRAEPKIHLFGLFGVFCLIFFRVKPQPRPPGLRTVVPGLHLRIMWSLTDRTKMNKKTDHGHISSISIISSFSVMRTYSNLGVRSTITWAAFSKSASTTKCSNPDSWIYPQRKLRLSTSFAINQLTNFSPLSEFVPCNLTTTGILNPPMSLAAAIIDSAIISQRTIPARVSASSQSNTLGTTLTSINIDQNPLYPLISPQNFECPHQAFPRRPTPNI